MNSPYPAPAGGGDSENTIHSKAPIRATLSPLPMEHPAWVVRHDRALSGTNRPGRVMRPGSYARFLTLTVKRTPPL